MRGDTTAMVRLYEALSSEPAEALFEDEAKSWCLIAAKKRSSEAMMHLGALNLDRAQHFHQALAWFRMAEFEGHKEATTARNMVELLIRRHRW